MKLRIFQYSTMLGFMIVFCNPDQFGIIISRLAAVCIAIAVAIALPDSGNRRSGRYLASLSVAEYGQQREIWVRNYRFHFVAYFMARRAALRYDFLGEAFNTTAPSWHVTDLASQSSRNNTLLPFN